MHGNSESASWRDSGENDSTSDRRRPPAVRQGLHMRLSAESDSSVIGEASDGEAALALVGGLCPDVVVMDVEVAVP